MTQAFNLAQLANNLNSAGRLDATDGLFGVLPVSNGGTGQSSLTANNVLLGNGTNGFQVVAPGTSGNSLISNGTTWVSGLPSKLSTANGSAPSYSVRCWGNFSSSSGSIVLRDSANVLGITYNSTGDYTVTFATGMPTSNYASVFGGSFNNFNSPYVIETGAFRTTNALQILTGGGIGRVNFVDVTFAIIC